MEWTPEQVAEVLVLLAECSFWLKCLTFAAFLGVGAMVWSDLHHGGVFTLGERMPKS